MVLIWEIYENIFKNNLCVYTADGSAFNNYLYPYKIIIKDNERGTGLRPKSGTYYGKKYEVFANDQDWGLYLATYYLKCPDFMRGNYKTRKTVDCLI